MQNYVSLETKRTEEEDIYYFDLTQRFLLATVPTQNTTFFVGCIFIHRRLLPQIFSISICSFKFFVFDQQQTHFNTSFFFLVSHNGKIAHFQKYPTANTDYYEEETRKTVCRRALEFVRNDDEVSAEIIEFFEDKKTEKLKLYILDDSSSAENTSAPAEIVPAYKCPTTPAIYIHVSFDSDGDPEYRIICKSRSPVPIFREFLVYQTKFADEIIEGITRKHVSTYVNLR